MFARLRQIIRAKARSRAVLVGTAVAVVAAGVPASALLLGHSTTLQGGQAASLQSGAQGQGAAGQSAGLQSLLNQVDPSGHARTQSGSSRHTESPKTTCPTGGVPASGTTINGGLIVDGVCTVSGVTINGGVVIEHSGHLTLYKSTVNGGTDVQSGGEFDSDNPEIAAGGNLLNGGIHATAPFDIDIHRGSVHGRTFLNGLTLLTGFVAVRFSYCGVDVQGDIVLDHLPTSPNGAGIGDPTDADLFAPTPCAGNTINGSIFIRDSAGSRIEVEGNTITGSVEIFDSTPSVSSNTIGGSLLCHQGGKLARWDVDDSNVNTMHGSNHC